MLSTRHAVDQAFAVASVLGVEMTELFTALPLAGGGTCPGDCAGAVGQGRGMGCFAEAPVDLLEQPDVLDKMGDARRGLVEYSTTPGAAVAGLIALIARYAQLAAGQVPASGIAFEKVSFAYPGSSRKVLRELDLQFPAGTSTASVGLNGAGKARAYH